MKKEFSLFEFLWRSSLVLFWGFLAALNLMVGIRDGVNEGIFVGLILCVPTLIFLLGWMDVYYDHFFGEKKGK